MHDENNLDGLFQDDWPEDHRSGVVAVVGRPNAGKSTLINAILGQKVAIVSPKPQTTRKQQLGIYSTDKAQVLFVDTPGLHKPQHKLGEYMVNTAQDALRDADVILWIIDVSESLHTGDKYIAETLKTVKETPILIALNKIDAANRAAKSEVDYTPYLELVEHKKAYPISALKGEGVQQIITDIVEFLPEGPRYYPADQVSDLNLRFMASEIIREKVMLHTEKEVPHAVAVDVEQYREREDGTHYVNATIYVERDSQKGIIIGKGGSMIKTIGTEARQDLEQNVGAPFFVDLHVKVLKNWRSNENLMKRLGYRMPRGDEK